MIGSYNATGAVTGPANLSLAIGKRLTLARLHRDRPSGPAPGAASTRPVPWLRDGRLVCDETIVDGLENAPEAFIGLLRGQNTGKMVVRI